MDISFDHELDESFIENNKGTHNDSSCMEDEILNEYYPINNFSFLNSKENNHNMFHINENAYLLFVNQKRENNFFDEDIQNSEQRYFLTLSNSAKCIKNINKETNLSDLNEEKSKLKQIFEIKKEHLPKFFTESSINIKIRQYKQRIEIKTFLGY